MRSKPGGGLREELPDKRLNKCKDPVMEVFVGVLGYKRRHYR